MRLIAYLDAGTGSVILQALIGGVAAIGVGLKFYGRRLLVFLHLRKPDVEEESPDSA